MTEERSVEIPDLLLALCVLPQGVTARDAAIDVGDALLTDLYTALYNQAPDRGSSIPDDSDFRINVAEMHIVNIALSLVRGVRALLPSNTYAAHALVRQLVEVEYLAWACANDRDEIVEWLLSDRQTRLNKWGPAQMRKRAGGRFDEEDYRSHCEIGGHPTAAGGWALFGPTEAMPQLAAMPEVTLYEATLHFVAICDFLAHGAPSITPNRRVRIKRAHAQRASWHAQDPACMWPRFQNSGAEADPALLAVLAEGVQKLYEERDG